MAVTGGCLCRTVRFEVTAEPLAARACWCRLCQFLGAGSGMVSVCFPSDVFTLQGEVAWYESIADSGNAMSRGFCPRCGTPLFSKAQSRPHLIFIRAGALDNPNLMGPQVTIWTSAAPGWACFDPGLPQIKGQPPPVPL